MKRMLFAFASSLLLVSGIFALNLPASSAAGSTLATNRGSLSWSEPWYVDTRCTHHDINYQNISSTQLLALRISILDSVGHEVAYDSYIGLEAGAQGAWDVQICGNTIPQMLTEGLGPYTLRLKTETFSSGTSQADTAITFTNAPSFTPSPAPTVTVTATPSPAPTVTVTATPDSTIKKLKACLSSAKKIIAVKKGRLPSGC